MEATQVSPTERQIRFFDAKTGEIQAQESVFYNEKNEVIAYELEQKQTGEKARLDITSSTVRMRYQQKNQKPEENQIQRQKNFLLPPLILEYLYENFAKLKQQKKLPVQLAVPHWNTYFSFEYRWQASQPHVVEFVATNFLIRLGAPKLRLEIDEHGRVLRASGPSLLKRRRGEKWEAFTGRSEMEYSSERPR